jgi:hypothetical protein
MERIFIMKIQRESNRFITLTVGLAFFGLCTQKAQAFDVWSQSIMGVSQNIPGSQMGFLDFQSQSDNSVSATSTNTSFTGLDGNGNQQTMNFTGSNWAQSNYGILKNFATGTVTNTYSNAANPIYYDSNTNTFDPNGSPDTLISLGFAGFNDTLHFGGSLQAGYQARYYWHVEGNNSDGHAVGDMAFGIQGYADESFFAFAPGSYNETWVTQSYAVDGINPQNMHVFFSNQFVVDAFNEVDGSTISGTSNFSSTVTLAGIEMLDENGNQVSDWTMTADSGTHYALIGTVPESSSIFALTIGTIGVLAARRRRSRA